MKLTEDEPLAVAGEFRISASRFRLTQRTRGMAKNFETEPGIAAAPVARGDTDLADRATVLITTEPNPASEALSLVRRRKPRRSLGLGARLRKLGRSFERGGEASSSVESASGPGMPSSEPGSSDDSARTSMSGPASSLSSQPGLAEQEAAANLEAGKCLVVLDSDSGSVSLSATVGQTILEAAREAGLARAKPVDWECGDGGCGVCVMGVVEGADRLDPPDPATGEMRTIQITEQVVPDPRKYRLACLARVRGTVRLRKLT